MVEEVIKCYFTYWYRIDSSPEGRMFVDRYKVPGTPYVGLLDPRTGGLVKCFAGAKGVPDSAFNMTERCKCKYILECDYTFIL